MSIHKLSMSRNQGFFSDFLTLVNGILYCHDQGYDYYIDWKNIKYSDNNSNLFNNYFWQLDRKNGPFETIHYANTPDVKDFTPYGEFFPQFSKITEKSIYDFLYRPAQVMAEHNIFNNSIFTNISQNYFGNNKVLGFHKRGTDHWGHCSIISDQKWMEHITEIMSKEHFDKIFCISDEEVTIEFFRKEFGDIFMYTDSFRSKNKSAIHGGSSDQFNYSKSKLAEEVIRDAVLLSLTDVQVLSRSNVTAFVLLYDFLDPKFDQNRIKFIDNHLPFN